jgi:chemotaxis protein CheD
MIKKVYLKPGDCYIGNKDISICTVLGSCISVLFYHPDIKFTALCHCMLPDSYKNDENNMKYISNVIPHIIEKIKQENIDINEFKICVYGGSSINNSKIGNENINYTINLLNKYNLSITHKEIGGNVGRTLTFNTKFGNLNIKYQI